MPGECLSGSEYLARLAEALGSLLVVAIMPDRRIRYQYRGQFDCSGCNGHDDHQG